MLLTSLDLLVIVFMVLASVSLLALSLMHWNASRQRWCWACWH